MATNTPDQHQTFSQKVWIAGGILSFIAVFLLLLKATFGVLLLILAGVLVAVFLRGLSGLLQRKTRWREGLCVTLSIVGTLSFVVLLFWLMGAKITGQVSQLTDTLPKTVENAKQYLNQSPLGQKLVERFSSPGTAKKAQGLAQTAFKSTFGVLGDLYAVLFLGIFFTVSPLAYKKGLIQLVPPKGQPKAAEVMAKLSENLTKWLKGKLFAMLVVFLLTAIGLVLIGVPMWLALALMAGILNFIPNFGPLLALIPAVLVGLLLGPTTAAWVAGLYILVQVAESNFITPMVQQRLLSIPPAMILIAQLLIAPLTGGWGLVLATPLLVIIMTGVQELYIRKEATAKD